MGSNMGGKPRQVFHRLRDRFRPLYNSSIQSELCRVQTSFRAQSLFYV